MPGVTITYIWFYSSITIKAIKYNFRKENVFFTPNINKINIFMQNSFDSFLTIAVIFLIIDIFVDLINIIKSLSAQQMKLTPYS